MSSTFGIICIHGKELLRQLAFHQEYKRSHNETYVRQSMESRRNSSGTSSQDEISGVKTIDWENSSWKYLSLIGDEQVITVFSAQKSTYFQILCSVLVRYTRTPDQT